MSPGGLRLRFAVHLAYGRLGLGLSIIRVFQATACAPYMTYPLWQRSDGELLKALREQAGLDPVVLARMGTMTVHQLRGLEDGQGGEFYSPQIKAHMGRSLLAKLGHVVPASEPDNPPPLPQFLPDTVYAQPIGNPPRSQAARAGRLPLIAGGLLALALGAFALVKSATPRQPAADAEAAPVSSPPAVATGPEVAAADTLATNVPDCDADAAAPSVAYTPSDPRKAGNFVYLVADRAAHLCVVDAARTATRLDLEPGAARSVHGKAPFLVRGDLSHLRIFFQGVRVAAELGASSQVVLKEAPLQ